jgi:NTE family protein
MKTGFRPAFIVGTSVGALNGTFLAFHPDKDGTEQLVDIWSSLRGAHLFGRNPLKMAFRLASRRAGLLSSDFLRDLIQQHLPVDDFAATEVPLHITATNLTRGEKVVFKEGPISPAILASTAIPGLFPPIEIDDQLYADGGIMANLDLETAVNLGAKKIIAIDVVGGQTNARPTNVVSVVTRSLDLLMRERVDRDVEYLSKRARITVLRPSFEESDAPGLGDMRHVGRLIDKAERLGEQLLGRCLDGKGRFRPGIVERPDQAPITR